MKMPVWPVPIGYRDIKFGLERINELLRRLGNPHHSLPPVIHVAGTNGKGSTIAFMRSILEAAGYKVHVYTSPHLVEFNERIVLAGEEISDAMLNDASEECKQAAGDLPITFFEGVTALALLLFSRVHADVVLLETGCGGRLDATNVLKNPAVTVITSISKDHMHLLGDDVAQIAEEKARIMKKGTLCLSAHQPPVVEAVLHNVAEEVETTVRFVDMDESYELGLAGKHQYINAALAVAAVEALSLSLLHEDIVHGLQSAKWLARMQHLRHGELADLLPSGSELWLDGGHNEAASRVIMEMVSKKWSDLPLYIVCAMLKDKDHESFLRNVVSNAEGFYTVGIEDEPDAMDATELKEYAGKLGIDSHVCGNVAEALGCIIDKENQPFRVLICGSLYLAGTVLAYNG